MHVPEPEVMCTSSVQLTSARMWSLVHSRQHWGKKQKKKKYREAKRMIFCCDGSFLSDSSV